MIHLLFSYLLHNITLLKIQTLLLILLSLVLPLLLSRQMRRSTPELAAAAEHCDSRNDDHYRHYRYHYYSCYDAMMISFFIQFDLYLQKPVLKDPY